MVKVRIIFEWLRQKGLLMLACGERGIEGNEGLCKGFLDLM
jgi:hypothetical protein